MDYTVTGSLIAATKFNGQCLEHGILAKSPTKHCPVAREAIPASHQRWYHPGASRHCARTGGHFLRTSPP